LAALHGSVWLEWRFERLRLSGEAHSLADARGPRPLIPATINAAATDGNGDKA
jgi:hypothetical protein